MYPIIRLLIFLPAGQKQWLPWLPYDVITKCKKWKKSVKTYITLQDVAPEQKEIF